MWIIMAGCKEERVHICYRPAADCAIKKLTTTCQKFVLERNRRVELKYSSDFKSGTTCVEETLRFHVSRIVHQEFVPWMQAVDPDN
jgi:hypothetical protein